MRYASCVRMPLHVLSALACVLWCDGCLVLGVQPLACVDDGACPRAHVCVDESCVLASDAPAHEGEGDEGDEGEGDEGEGEGEGEGEEGEGEGDEGEGELDADGHLLIAFDD